MARKHSTPLRGLTVDAVAGPEFEGRFGRMFPGLKAAKFGETDAEARKNLKALADAMCASFDGPKDGPDPEESGIPALYTYFGQFVDHDLTFDPNSSLQKANDPHATIDYRSPAFDLDNVYGRGPDDQPYMYQTGANNIPKFILGDPISQGYPAGATDLQRNGAGRALIGDPRNDENAIVSQLQGLVQRFHNRMADDMAAKDPNTTFAEVQSAVRFHYQYVVINDFLARIVNGAVLDSLRLDGSYDRNKIQFFSHCHNRHGDPFMPIEFSIAAYRLGHSMVRPGYRLNDAVLLPIFPLPPNETTGTTPLPEGLTGFRRLVSNWALDWGRFIDIDVRNYGKDPGANPGNADIIANFSRLQFAYRIDTSLVDPLKNLPPSVATNPSSLAERNLLRGMEFGLPSGQCVAKAMGIEPLKTDKIIIGKGVDPAQADPADPTGTIVARAGAVFEGNCPLWTYILAEAIQNTAPAAPTPVTEGTPVSTPQLGPVGGRIVAEVFLGLMFADKTSYLSAAPGWTPAAGKEYALKDFVAYALGL